MGLKSGVRRIIGSRQFLTRKLRELLVGKRSPDHTFSKYSQKPASDVGPDNTVAEFGKKLWAGFSQHARIDLDNLVHHTGADAEKVLAAWELAKFYAAQTQWERALRYLDIIRKIDRTFLRRKEPGLLYIDALTTCGLPKVAERHAQRKIDEGEFDADYHCALSNVIAARAVPNGMADTHLIRLALLNRIYKDSNVADLDLIDPLRGFSFGNLAIAEKCLSELRHSQTISVLMTVFNAEQHVSTSISSILCQTWRNVELIIVDDASTDASWEVINSLARREPRLVCVRNPTKTGTYQARNRALSLATGEYITVHDSEHWAHPQMLQTQVEAMLSDPEIKLSFSSTASVSSDMKYVLRLGPNCTEYVCRDNQSYVINTMDLQHLDKWDGVDAHADEEFIQRARSVWKNNTFLDARPNVPMSLGLKRAWAPDRRDVRSIASGTHREYAKQAEFWRKNVLVPARDAGQRVPIERSGTKQPFPIPGTLAPRGWPKHRHYNFVIITDLTLLGGTRRCNEGYIAAALNIGMNVGLLHWARYDLKLSDDIAKEYRNLSYGENVDILTADELVNADLVVIHHPPIMKYLPDEVPRIHTKGLAVLVNQLPSRPLDNDDPYYDLSDVDANCLKLFGMTPVWIPISPLVRRVLSEAGCARLAKEDWIPPLGEIVVVDSNARTTKSHRNRTPVVGRHSRDHWTKWPGAEKDLRSAYCADSRLSVRLLGGARSARQVLSSWPENWEEFAFDSMPVMDFLNDLDFFVHYTHSGYIEEFGRNIMEAMAAGVPVIVPPCFQEVFGDAACYAEPQRVEALINKLWDTKSAYVEQVDKGFHFVEQYASNERVERRLKEAILGIV